MAQPSSTPELDEAWRQALDARQGDVGPWRVLADVLLAAGDVRGEFMQLELDADLAPLRGLARGRHTQLVRDHWVELAPPGVAPGDVAFRLGAPDACTQDVERATGPDDARWRSVRRLAFRTGERPPRSTQWLKTPLSGSALERVEELRGLEPEGLEVLAAGPPRPRLRTLKLRGDPNHDGLERNDEGRLHAPWSALWRGVLEKHRGVREVDLGRSWNDGALVTRLQTIAPHPLDRVSFTPPTLSPTGVSEFARWLDWHQTHPTPFTLSIGFPQDELEACVDLVGDGLVLRASPGEQARARAYLELTWPADRPKPRLTLGEPVSRRGPWR